MPIGGSTLAGMLVDLTSHCFEALVSLTAGDFVTNFTVITTSIDGKEYTASEKALFGQKHK